MTRLARVVAVGVPHPVTQRGNARQFILDGDADRRVYLDRVRQSIALHSLELIGYCLMSNHVHLIVTPAKPDALGRALKDTHVPVAMSGRANSTPAPWMRRISGERSVIQS